MRPRHEIEQARRLFEHGLNDCQIARAVGTGRHNIRYWRTHNWDIGRYQGGSVGGGCPRCDDAFLDGGAYAYLLGLYLGDGYLSLAPKGVYKLRIVLDCAYPIIIGTASDAIVAVRRGGPNCVGFIEKVGCIEVYGFWKHWPCLFPQHGPGRKHLRPIVLAPWQKLIANAHPKELLRGLIRSDGCRDLNFVNGKSYPRYQFCNHSGDIRRIFENACDRLGMHFTRPSWRVVSISRRPEVEFLDTFIGPKT